MILTKDYEYNHLFRRKLSNNHDKLGIEINVRRPDGKVVVTKIMDPNLQRSNISKGDVITKIDGRDIYESVKSDEELLNHIKGFNTQSRDPTGVTYTFLKVCGESCAHSSKSSHTLGCRNLTAYGGLINS